MKSKINILIVVLVVALVSCFENDIVIDTKNLDYRVYEISNVPIAKIHVPLYKSVVKYKDIDEMSVRDGVICFTYTQSAKIKWDEDEIGINPLMSPPTWRVDVPDIAEWPGTQIEYSGVKTEKVQITTTSEDDESYVTYAELASLKMEFSFIIPTNLTGNLTITIPELKKNNVAFSKTYGNLQGSQNVRIENIENYIMDVPAKELQLECKFTVTNWGGKSGGTLYFWLEITEVVVDYMKGYFGKIDYKPEEADKKIEFDFFKDLDFDGTVGIKDIVFETKVINSIGAPMNVKADDIYFINQNGGKTEFINEDGTTKTKFDLDIKSAEINESNYTITPSDNFFSQKLGEFSFQNGAYPTAITFDFSGMLNPKGDNPEGKNFILRSGSDLAEAQVQVIVPLHVKVESFMSTDKLDFDYNDWIKDFGNDSGEEFSKSIEKCEVILKINNQLPIEVVLSADAIDATEKILIEEIVKIENLDAKAETTVKISLTQSQIEKLRTGNVTHLVLYTHAKSKNEEFVIVYETDYIDIDVSVNVKSSIPSNIFE